MKKSTKIWLITAAVLVFAGITGLACTVGVAEWDLSDLGEKELKTQTYNIDEDFTDISIKADTEDIVLLPSENGESKVVCEHKDSKECEVTVEDGTLIIKTYETGKWYENIRFFGFYSEKITVYLNKPQYSDVDIECSTGDIDIGSFMFGTLKTKISTGDISIKNTNCEKLISTGSTGDIKLQNVIASLEFNIKRSTGDITFDNCDAGEMTVKTSTGDVIGTLLTDKVFVTDSSTGDIKVPEGTSGGKCNVKTSTGDIIFDIVK